MKYPVTVVHNHWISMSDGNRLACRIWLPLKLETAKAFFPPETDMQTLIDTDLEENDVQRDKKLAFNSILEYLPYWKDIYTVERDFARHTKFAQLGYACWRVEIRGTGNSDGVYFDEYTEQEMLDCEEVLSYIGSRPWSNGKVAMYGKSWGGFNGLQMAARNPKHLTTVISLYSTDDRYHNDIHYLGGCVLGEQMVAWANQMHVWNARPPNPRYCPDWKEKWRARLRESVGDSWLKRWLSHPEADDAYWQHGSIIYDQDKVKIPILAIGGLFDGYTDGAFRMASWLNPESRIIIGPWGHNWPDVVLPGPNVNFVGLCHNWLSERMGENRTPKSLSSMDWPRLQVYLRYQHKPCTKMTLCEGEWIGLHDYTVKNLIKDQIYYLDISNNELTQNQPSCAPKNGESSISLKKNAMQGLFSGGWMSWGGGDRLAGDQRFANVASVTWSTGEIVKRFSIVGSVSLSFDVIGHGEVVARLCCQNADGSSTLISYGIQLVKRGINIESRQSLSILFQPTTFLTKPGAKLSLSLSGSWFPMILPSRSAEHGLEIFPSSAILKIPSLQTISGAPCSKLLDTLEPSTYNLFSLNTVIHTEPTDEDEVKIDASTGDITHWHKQQSADLKHPDIGIRFRDTQADTYITNADVSRVTVKAERQCQVLWEGNDPVSIEAKACLQQEGGAMHVEESLNAKLGNEQFFTQQCKYSIP